MFEDFARWLLLRGSVSVTNQSHIKILRVILRECNPLTYDTFERLMTSLLERGRSNTTINHYVGTMRLYARFADLDERLKTFSFMRVKPCPIKGTLSDAEIEDFLALPPPNKKYACLYAKDTLFFSILAMTGCRPAELANVRKEDVTDSVIKLNHTKTGRPRIIPIPPPVKDFLKCYISKCVTDYLFMTTRGKMYSYATWQHSFNDRIKRLGINRPNITLYSLRHSCATSLLKQDVSPFKIAKLLGNSVEIIEKNYSHLVISDLEVAITRLPIVSRHITPSPQELREQIESILKSYNGVSYTVKLTKQELQVKVRLNGAYIYCAGPREPTKKGYTLNCGN